MNSIATFNTITDLIEKRRQESGYYRKLTLPPLNKGNEKQIYKIDDTVQYTHLLKQGFFYVAKVLDVYKQNGFWYYIVTNIECRNDNNELVNKCKKKFNCTIRTKDLKL